VIFLAETRGTLDHGVVIEAAAVAEFDIVADDGVGADGKVGAELRGGRNDRACVNIIHNSS
jgi:hypothetical protein